MFGIIPQHKNKKKAQLKYNKDESLQISMAFNKYHSMFVCWKHGKMVKLTLVHKNAIMHVCLKIEE